MTNTIAVVGLLIVLPMSLGIVFYVLMSRKKKIRGTRLR